MMSEQKVPRSVEQRIVIKFLVGENVPTETLFPLLLLESVVNFRGRDVFSNEEFDHNALFHAPRYLLFSHHSQLPDRTEQVLTRAGGRVEVVASLCQGRTAAAQCGLFTHKSVPVIFEPPCNIKFTYRHWNCGQRLLGVLESAGVSVLCDIYRSYSNVR